MQVDRCDELASSSIDLFVLLLGVITIMGSLHIPSVFVVINGPFVVKALQCTKKKGAKRLELCKTHEKMVMGGGLLK
jgi:hypothetical protein